MNNLGKLISDFIGLIRVCGLVIASKWLFYVFTNGAEVFQRKNLQVADKAMGPGPFQIRLAQYGVSFKITGMEAISGIREMYVRDTYLHNGVLQINDGDIVLDLGANMGNFTNLALSFGQNVRVVAVEPNAESNAVLRQSVGLNHGYTERVTLFRAFVGGMSNKQHALIKKDMNYSDAPWITEDQLIHEGGLSRVDFFKCDIEGGEFELLGRDSKLLSMARSLAIEIHSFAGDVNKFIENLKSSGFSVLAIKRDPDGTATVLAKRI